MMNLKKLVLGVALLFSCVIFAQEKGDLSGFAGITYPLSSGSDMGVNLGVEYMFTDAIAAAPSFSYYFTPSGITTYAINADARYYIGGDESLKYFGLAGVSFMSTKIDGFGASVTDTGLNIGGGLIYSMGENIGLIAQAKYGTSGSAIEPMVGVNFSF
jgi:hypothetical protein